MSNSLPLQSFSKPNGIDLDKIEEILRPVKKVFYAILFGSALAHMRKDSDVDFLIGGNLSFDDKLALASQLERALGRKVDLVSVQEAPCELVMGAFHDGQILFAKHRKFLKEDYFRNLYRYEDTEPLRRIKNQRLKKKLRHG